ncbi:putative O-linked N-acetylglucosamine transferase, SPINDLY family [Bacteroidales bacterium Barb7]|nr:putative O-linked N-acetylglucosamine transferase, SPINDLY family [Bacteroidales bacterium Barb7]
MQGKSMHHTDTIKQLINEGKTEEAVRLSDAFIEKGEASDTVWYLRGNACRKQGDMRQALNSYLRAMELNPDSPAQQAYNMLIDILNFYNKDMYNQ